LKSDIVSNESEMCFFASAFFFFLSPLVGAKEKSYSLDATNVSATNIHIKVQLCAFQMCGIHIVLSEHIIKEAKEPINVQL